MRPRSSYADEAMTSETRVYYDADCGFCTRSVDLLRSWGATASFSALQTADLDALGIDRERAAMELPAVSGGEVSWGADAVRVALSTGTAWMRGAAALGGRWPLAPLSHTVYRWVAAHRQQLPGGTPECEISPRNDRLLPRQP